MSTATIRQLPPALRAELIDYLVQQPGEDANEARAYWKTYDGQELIDAYNYARTQNGLPVRIFILPNDLRPRYRDQEPGSWQEV